jgi:sugar phosphate isomerase/epimerase
MSRLGIELLSVFGLAPVDYVHLAAELGCSHISTGLTQGHFNPHKYAPWSLRDDPALRRATVAACRDSGVKIALGEGLIARPGIDLRDAGPELDLFAELGTERIGTLSMDPDAPRARDQIAALVEMARARGMAASIEFAPPHPVGTLDAAIALARDIGGVTVTVDVMHFTRSGGTIAQLKAADPALIGYGQLCDVPLTPPHGDYMKEAMFQRLPLGEGGTAWQDIVAALPRDIPLSLEIPQLAKAEAGVSPYDRLKSSADAAKALLQRLDA